MTERFMVFLADDDAVKCEVVPSSAYDQILSDNERLRESDLYEAGWDDCAKEKDADLAKLTSAYAELDGLRHAACDQRDAYKAEIERLRQERDDILAAKEIVFAPPAIPESFVIQELQKANVALHADIARLRSGARCPHCDELRLELGALRKHFDIIQSAANGKDAEIERLRGEHQEYVATAMALQNAVAEIARLRALVSESR